MEYFDAKLIRQTNAIHFLMEPHIYDLERGEITDLNKFQQKLQYGTKLIQLNYSTFKDFEIKNLL